MQILLYVQKPIAFILFKERMTATEQLVFIHWEASVFVVIESVDMVNH